MSTQPISDGEAGGAVRAKINEAIAKSNTALQPGAEIPWDDVTGKPATFPSRAAFQAATIAEDVDEWTVLHAGLVLRYVRDPSGTAIESGNGVKGYPAETARPEHWGAMRDGVANDGPAINAACAWGTRVHLTGGIYRTQQTIRLVNTLLTGGNQEWPEDNRVTILGAAEIPVADPLVAPIRGGKIEHMRLEYEPEAITGNEVEGQRRLVGALEGQPQPQRGCAIRHLRMDTCGTGIGGLSFSVTYSDIEITGYTFAAMDVGRGTGNTFNNIYASNLSGSTGLTPAFGLRIRQEYGGFYSQINIEHTYFREAALRVENCPSVSFSSIHLEGVNTTSPGGRFIHLDSANVEIGGLTAIYCGMSHDNTALIELGNSRMNDGWGGATIGRSQNARLSIRSLYLEGVTNPNTGLHPSYPEGRRGLQNIPGFRFLRRTASFTDAGYQVEVGVLGHSSFPTTGGVAEQVIYENIDRMPYTDCDRLGILRVNRRGELITAQPSLGYNGRFDQWVTESAVASSATPVESAKDWLIRNSSGELRANRTEDGLRVSNAGTLGTFQELRWRMLRPEQFFTGETFVLSFEAKATVAGQRLKQMRLMYENAGGTPTGGALQIIGGDSDVIAFPTDWRSFHLVFNGFAPGTVTNINNLMMFVVFQFADSNGFESTIDLRNVKIERGVFPTKVVDDPARDASPVFDSLAEFQQARIGHYVQTWTILQGGVAVPYVRAASGPVQSANGVKGRVATATSVSVAPVYAGQTAVVGGEAYIAVGTASADDWQLLGATTIADVTGLPAALDARRVVVAHGADAGTVRPDAALVEWVGSVAPTNAQAQDTWLDTSA